MGRILVVDDEAPFRAVLRDILEDAGHAVVEAADGIEALIRLREERFHLVLTDQRMPRMDGLELLREIRALPDAPRVVILTAYGSIPEAVEAVRLGAADYTTKPLSSPAAFMALVDRTLSPEHEEHAFITEDPRLQEILQTIDRAAQTDVTVLITGESGTGKELIARRLHTRSPRAGGPFVAINCAALPEALAESELFGHERGAFTGADRCRKGRFEEADGGTLLLDEVGELSPALQAKLLRSIETRTVRHLGGAEDIPVDTRLVAATNRDLAGAVREGTFREDLFFRIAVVLVHLPPLREHPGDIALIVRHLVEKLVARHRLPQTRPTEAAIAALGHYRWPGNVRELRNVLERALVMRSGREIRPEDLLLPQERDHPADLKSDRESRERELVIDALRRSGGNREQAARELGISVRTLYYRLRRWGISG